MNEITVSHVEEKVISRRVLHEILVMFTGGIDSTASLKWLLENTDYILHVHHIDFTDAVGGRNIKEKEAVASILKYFDKYSDRIKYSDSVIDMRGNKIRDAGWVSITAVAMARNLRGVHEFIYGTCKEDNLIYTVDETYASSLRICAAHPNLPPLQKKLPISNNTKRQNMDYLGEELLALTWSCREPVHNDDGTVVACGTCTTCYHISKK